MYPLVCHEDHHIDKQKEEHAIAAVVPASSAHHPAPALAPLVPLAATRDELPRRHRRVAVLLHEVLTVPKGVSPSAAVATARTRHRRPRSCRKCPPPRAQDADEGALARGAVVSVRLATRTSRPHAGKRRRARGTHRPRCPRRARSADCTAAVLTRRGRGVGSGSGGGVEGRPAIGRRRRQTGRAATPQHGGGGNAARAGDDAGAAEAHRG
eukprot:CAMPEP_0181350306 /NCGR_PEP_ID=MMETSP1106-20121128/1194_1 /TAXON_ID=81844 /ORGANISM="Mantoniella antarctica, Strain SL-175" /LENGTH=210 /DNA_ID=CAMNT_0023462767 /DNA_START=924 /DNA_END=1552 /DNA_ORIENTATION=-